MMNVKRVKGNYNPKMLKDGIVRVGWFGGIRYEDGLSVAQVAKWQEYGTGGKYPIPPRPFMRPVLHGQGNYMRDHLRKIYSKALKDNKNTLDVLGRFGEYVTSQIRQSIRLTVNPPNSEVTLRGGWLRTDSGVPFHVEGKRGNHPLIDTGFMIGSITYQLEEVPSK